MLSNLSFQAAETIWTLEGAEPKLWHHLIEQRPWLTEVASALRGGCPVAPSLEPFEHGNCVRPPRHFRAFYARHPEGPVVAIKGSEVASENLERAFSQFYSVGARWSAIEQFALHEQKLGMAVYVTEALQEADIAARFQAAHLEKFSELAEFPIHIAVLRFSREMGRSYMAKLKKFASERNQHQSSLLVESGLAAYVYYFPHLPIRVSHIVPSHGPAEGIFDARTRDSVLRAKHGYDAAIASDAYFRLVGRMLSLGFFPLSLASFGAGYCTSAQNVTTKGAMVDAESLFPFGSVKNEWEFATTFLTTLASLCATAKVLLYAPLPFVRFEFADPSTISVLLADLVWNRVRDEVTLCAKAGLEIDQRLQWLLAQPSISKVLDLSQRMHPARTDFFLAGHFASGHDHRGWD